MGKKIVFSVFGLVAGAILVLMIWLAPSFLSLNTVHIDNRSPIPVVVEIYDYSWRVESGAHETKRFQSNRGDASYRIIDPVTNAQMQQVGYVTGSMSDCQLIRINPDYSIDASSEFGVLCHVTGAGRRR